jgi:hypothetical protein
MRSHFALEPAQIAEMYVRAKGGAHDLPRTAKALYEDVKAYLRDHGLDHRLDEAAEIAIAAYELAKAELQPVASPEQTAWANDQAQGIGDRLPDEIAFRQADERVLAAQIRSMSMPEFAASRERLGLAQDLTSFLGGRNQ